MKTLQVIKHVNGFTRTEWMDCCAVHEQAVLCEWPFLVSHLFKFTCITESHFFPTMVLPGNCMQSVRNLWYHYAIQTTWANNNLRPTTMVASVQVVQFLKEPVLLNEAHCSPIHTIALLWFSLGIKQSQNIRRIFTVTCLTPSKLPYHSILN